MRVVREMRQLSARLVDSIRLAGPAEGEAFFAALGSVLSEVRGREVALRRVAFPPDTASGVWLDLGHMDIIAVREDAADAEHERVIVGHEIWHMLRGHCGMHTSLGVGAARAREAEQAAVEEIVRLLTDAEGAPLSSRAVTYAMRTHFDESHEQEAELFGMQFGTDLRMLARASRRVSLDQVAGRIETSLGGGPWA